MPPISAALACRRSGRGIGGIIREVASYRNYRNAIGFSFREHFIIYTFREWFYIFFARFLLKPFLVGVCVCFLVHFVNILLRKQGLIHSRPASVVGRKEALVCRRCLTIRCGELHRSSADRNQTNVRIAGQLCAFRRLATVRPRNSISRQSLKGLYADKRVRILMFRFD